MRRYMRLKKHLTSFQIIIMGFAGVILAGAFLLMLPFSSTSGKITPFFDALFTSTSAVCVTGLVVVDSGSYWTMFGQAVILLLIQIGGLGVITIAVAFAMLSGKKISLMQRSVMQSTAGGRYRKTDPFDPGWDISDRNNRSRGYDAIVLQQIWNAWNLDGSISLDICVL